MISASLAPSREARGARVRWLAAIAFCGVLPVVALVLFYASLSESVRAFDFRPFYRAAGAILDGNSPYPAADDALTAEAGPYVYPPLGALVAIPFRAVPFDVAAFVVIAVLTLAVVAIPFLLGVRDWRCYGIVFLWPPVWNAIQTGNMTLLLGVAAALVWRFRDVRNASAAALGVALAAKLFLWPLAVWLAATRRVASAVLAVGIGTALVLVSWAVIGFAGLVEYPELMRRLQDTVGLDSYTLYIVGLDVGLPSAVARAVWLACGTALLAAVVVLGRRREERLAFVAAVAAMLALTPIVWLHYFALLLLVVSLAQPRLGVLWFVPMLLVLTPGSGQPTPFETAWTLGVAALAFALAARSLRAEVPARRVGPVTSAA